MQTFEQFITEGFFHVSAIIQGNNGPKRIEGNITNQEEGYNREAVLMQFLGRHMGKGMTHKELKQWFLKYKDICNVRWVPEHSSLNPKQSEVSFNVPTERKSKWLNFPIKD